MVLNCASVVVARSPDVPILHWLPGMPYIRPEFRLPHLFFRSFPTPLLTWILIFTFMSWEWCSLLRKPRLCLPTYIPTLYFLCRWLLVCLLGASTSYRSSQRVLFSPGSCRSISFTYSIVPTTAYCTSLFLSWHTVLITRCSEYFLCVLVWSNFNIPYICFQQTGLSHDTDETLTPLAVDHLQHPVLDPAEMLSLLVAPIGVHSHPSDVVPLVAP